MTVFEIVCSIVLFIAAVAVIVIILSQQGKDAYLGGAVAGGAAETFLGKKKAGTIDSFLTKVTRILGIVVVALVLLVNISSVFK
jgi:preprotein translocase subunit SecG